MLEDDVTLIRATFFCIWRNLAIGTCNAFHSRRILVIRLMSSRFRARARIFLDLPRSRGPSLVFETELAVVAVGLRLW